MRLKLQPQVTALFRFSDSYWGEEGVRGGEVSDSHFFKCLKKDQSETFIRKNQIYYNFNFGAHIQNQTEQ